MTELTYAERETLAQDLGKIVNQYFSNSSWGLADPFVNFFQYDPLHYTFGMTSRTRSSIARYVLRYEKSDELNAFRKEVRTLLKSKGFKRIKFDLKNAKTSYYNCYGTMDAAVDKVLAGIYFDW